jgi:hypothetical protein
MTGDFKAGILLLNFLFMQLGHSVYFISRWICGTKNEAEGLISLSRSKYHYYKSCYCERTRRVKASSCRQCVTLKFTCFYYTIRKFHTIRQMWIKIKLFWNITTCRLLNVYKRFRGVCCLYLQGWSNRKLRTTWTLKMEARSPSKVSAIIRCTTPRLIPEDFNFQRHLCDNLKYHNEFNSVIQWDTVSCPAGYFYPFYGIPYVMPKE